MRLLVAGAGRVDAGKTTFSTGLLDRIDGVGFKPRAANDYWFDHDDYDRAISEGRLYGKDAKRLSDASTTEVSPEAINPIHRLWQPLPGADTGIVGPGRRQFLCDRVGAVPGDVADWAVGDLVTNGRAEVPDSLHRNLPIEDGTTVNSMKALNAAMAAAHKQVLGELTDRIHATDRAVIESYADIARPIEDLSVDAVAVVEPGRAQVYDGERYGRACSVVSSSPRDGQLERKVEDVIDPLDPVATVRLPALEADERQDPATVRSAYELAYDALLGAAVG